VDPHADANRRRRERPLCVGRRVDGISGTRERAEDRVALRVDLDAAVRFDGLPHEAAVLRERVGIRLAEALEQARRPLDVGEEQSHRAAQEFRHRRHDAALRVHSPELDWLTMQVTKDDVVEALRQVEDPELGMDIVDLGLLYDVDVTGSKVKVTHSLTSMGCPAGPMIQEDIHRVASELPGVDDVEIELTWDPPWTPDKMSEDAKFILGFG
jgi:metal-sulfur cluster biosynthetic enzyme